MQALMNDKLPIYYQKIEVAKNFIADINFTLPYALSYSRKVTLTCIRTKKRLKPPKTN